MSDQFSVSISFRCTGADAARRVSFQMESLVNQAFGNYVEDLKVVLSNPHQPSEPGDESDEAAEEQSQPRIGSAIPLSCNEVFDLEPDIL